jgi:DNA-binding YbaB/EbfC family protein
MVVAKANGRQELLSIDLEPEVVDPDDIEMLQDLIVAAVNDALKRAQEMAAEEMSKLTGGLKLPGGMKIPGMF